METTFTDIFEEMGKKAHSKLSETATKSQKAYVSGIAQMGKAKAEAYEKVQAYVGQQTEKADRIKVSSSVMQADVATAVTAFHETLNKDDSMGSFERGTVKVISTPINAIVGLFKGWS